MSTGAEILARISEADRRIDLHREAMRKIEKRVIAAMFFGCFGRECGAQRARVLRRRGCDVRFKRRTSTGKVRYVWLPPAPRIRTERVDGFGPNTHAVRMWFEDAQ